jgi:hypothetical protein
LNSTPKQSTRIETLLAATIFLMTHYARTGCPRLAVCVSRHLQCLYVHPDVDPVIREICASVRDAWVDAAVGRPPVDSLH